MSIKIRNIPCLLEDFTSTAEIFSVLSDEFKKIERKFATILSNVDEIPCLVFFNKKTPLEKLRNFLKGRNDRSNKYTLAVAIKKEDIEQQVCWELFADGVSDILCWETIPNAGEVIVNRIERWLDVEIILQSPKIRNSIIGRSERWLSILREVIEVARFSKLSVLITGESGTGKELISKLIHQLDTRVDKEELVLADCSCISRELSGSEFFGHEKGAYTGAIASRDGAFALANKGTLFLDEIGELPMNLQAELLRVIQEGTYKRVGSNIWKHTSFRLVSATNRCLLSEVNDLRFRQDLYYRISGWVVELPPLRERIEDIPNLVEHFIKECCGGEQYIEVDDKLMSYLQARSYPGNIRELRQLVQRLMLKYTGNGPLTIGLLSKEELKAIRKTVVQKEDNHFLYQGVHKSLLSGIGVKEMKELVGDIAIKIALEQENGNLQRAANKLGLTDRSLQLWKKTNTEYGAEALSVSEN